jgi:ATP-binding cassette subfamily F protein uup
VVAAEGGGRWVEYAGGYSDMLVQSGGAELFSVGTATAPPTRPRAGAEPSAPVARTKLSFKDKHALAALPARIAALQAQIADAHATLAEPRLYGADPHKFGRVSATLARAEAELAEAEEKWLELEMLREAVEGR